MEYSVKTHNGIFLSLEVRSYKLYNNKYMIPLTQITNTDIFTFIAVLVFKLLKQ